MSSIINRLNQGEILVSDGAIGSLLFQSGLPQGECPESINLTNPGILERIAHEYLEAGADIIQTNTFGASPLKLTEYQLEDRTEDINKAAVQSVRKVVNGKAYVSGSIGPSGKILKPYGDTDPDDLFKSFKYQAQALINAGVDLTCIETMMDLQEIILAIKAVKAVSSQTTVIATMTFDETPSGFYTIMGTSVKEAANGLQEAGAQIIGSNCGNGIEKMIKIAREFKKVTELPVIIQSNAGEPTIKDGTLVYPESPEFYAEKTKELIDIGVAIIGGCCGTTPEYVKAIRRIVDSYQ